MTTNPNKSRRFLTIATSLTASLALSTALSVRAEDADESGSGPDREETRDTSAGTLYFINGDRLSGSLISISDDGQRFHWKVAYADDIVEIDRNKVAAIDFKPPASLGESKSNTVVKLTNGDEIFAKLSGLQDQKLELSTSFADELKLERQMVGNVEIMDEGIQILANLDSLDDWENVRNEWKVINGSIISPSSGQIAYDIGDIDRVKVSFDLTSSASTYSISVHAFADNPTSPDSGTNYRIQLGNRWLQASKTQVIEKKGMFRNDGRDTIILGKESGNIEMRSLVATHLDFYFDRTDGKVAVYLDGKPLGTWDDPGEFVNPGSFIALTVSSRERVLFDSFSILRWNGILPKDTQQLEPGEKDSDTTTIALANGDALSGTVDTITDDTLLMDTEDFGELRIAISRIRQLNLAMSKLWDQARRHPTDVIATFHDGSKITFALRSFTEDVATLYSENFGTIHTNLDNIQSMRLLHTTENSIDPTKRNEFRQVTPQEALGDRW